MAKQSLPSPYLTFSNAAPYLEIARRHLQIIDADERRFIAKINGREWSSMCGRDWLALHANNHSIYFTLPEAEKVLPKVHLMSSKAKIFDFWPLEFWEDNDDGLLGTAASTVDAVLAINLDAFLYSGPSRSHEERAEAAQKELSVLDEEELRRLLDRLGRCPALTDLTDRALVEYMLDGIFDVPKLVTHVQRSFVRECIS